MRSFVAQTAPQDDKCSSSVHVAMDEVNVESPDLLGRALDGLTGHDGPEDLGVAHVFRRNGKDIAVEEDEIGAFAGRDGTDLVEQIHGAGGIARVSVEHGEAGHVLRSVEDTFGALAGFGLIDSVENVGGGDGPVAGPGDEGTAVEK